MATEDLATKYQIYIEGEGFVDSTRKQLAGLIKGEIYTDGSCYPGTFDGMARAGWGFVVMNGTTPICRVFGPCWRPLPQTAPSGEFAAWAAAAEMADDDAALRSDCKLVVSVAARSTANQLKPELVHAGFAKGILAHPGARLIKEVTKVKAHVDPASVSDAGLRQQAICNGFADEAAKLGARAHAWAEAQVMEAELLAKRAGATLKALAGLLPLWPKAFGGDGEAKLHSKKRPAPIRKARVVPSRGHSWTSHGGSLHCSVCTAFLHKPTLTDRRAAEECPGVNLKLAAVLKNPQGHRLFVAAYGGLPLVFCGRCGAFGTDFFRNLSDPCREPGEGGRSQLKRLLACRHPVKEVVLTGVCELARAMADYTEDD
jgi:ribonuclease HI